MKKLIVLLTLVVFSVTLWAETKTMTVQEVHKAMQDSSLTATLIDVRTPREYAEGHIDGSINVPVGDISAYIEDLYPLDGKGVIVYCRSGRRAARAIETLTEAGFKKITHMEGDMAGWYDAELPVVTAN